MTAVPTPERELARRLLAQAEIEGRASGSARGAGSAAERVFQCLHTHLAKSIGPEGFRALLARAIERSRSEYPLLAGLPHAREPEWPSNGFLERIHAENPAEATEALVVLIATFIALLGRFVGAGLAARMVEQSWPATSPRDSSRLGSGEQPHD